MRSRYGIPDVTSSGTQGIVSQIDTMVQERRASAIRREMKVTVGFDDEMERIVETLLDISEKPGRCVVSLVGMGGAGKSTLARRICNRADVMGSFDVYALVTVSQTLNLRKIFEDIVKKLSGVDREAMHKMDEEELKKEVFRSLHGKRYLIVLDDIWEPGVWPLICLHLPDEKNGSRVIITTRSTVVAKSADSSIEPHQLRPLRDQESWELFTKIVFPDHDGDAEEVCTEELKKVGKKILKNCGGLPLAIVLMGGLLVRRVKSPIAWEDAVKGVSWEEVHQGVLPKVVGLSYRDLRDLPHHLKSCFLYLSHFPEDFDIDADELIRMWVAEGFVPDRISGQYITQNNNYRTMEETAQGWLEDLVGRCLVQVVERTPSGMWETCRMHDVLRGLSMKEAEKANFFHTWQQQVASVSPQAKTRRLALHKVAEGNGCTFQHVGTPKLRTFVGIELDIQQPSLPFLMGLRLIRVLNLSECSCGELPKAIGDLIHLRYLGLRSCYYLRSIPSSVGNLQNLQTLDVLGTNLREVPDGVWKIRMLRHLVVGDLKVGHHLLQLVNLQTLWRVRAGSWMESSLAMLTSLRELSITEISEAHHSALSDSLDTLVHLRHLSLIASGDDFVLPRKALALPNHHRLQRLVLYGRLKLVVVDAAYGSDEMPPNLNELFLKGSELHQDPFLLLEKLKYLKRLVLRRGAYEGGEEAVCCCSASRFPQLEELDLWDESCLIRWRVEDGAMPCLRSLEIDSCEQLEMLPDGLRHLTTLQMLTILAMPKKFERRLEEGGEDWHKIQHIPNVKINVD